MKKLIVLLILIHYNFHFADIRIFYPEKKGKTSFAIFVDSITFQKTFDAIVQYKKSIENDNLPTFILVSNWLNPEEVKNEIIKLYNSEPKLEGAVFIGDIPIPMIREAQHLTSAFKLEETRFSWDRSSVPSDRFYDDLDLKFEFLRKDSVNKLYFYYRLLPDSPQKIEKEIYTARIKPSPDSLKYEKIEQYLLRIVKQKEAENYLNNVLVFTGHGYNSESLTSWVDESLILLEHFPLAFNSGGRFKKYFYEMNKEIKKVILSELENPELDLAIFHAHGVSDAQLLSSYRKARNVNENIESVKFYLRSKLRAAKERGESIDEVKENFKRSLNVPDAWFEGAFDERIMRQDSILNYNLDIYINDIRKLKPQAKVVVFDECFNGSFHLEEYIAGEYVFGNGETIAAIANSVNVLQDLFVTELIGLLNLNFSIGKWHKYNNYLESHLIGDPTFKFSNRLKNNLEIELKNFSEKDLKKFLISSDPVIRTFALLHLFKIKREKISDQLMNIYLKDPSPNVRLMALKCLAELRDKNFELILHKSINDPNELIRRFSVIWMGLIGKKEFIHLIVKSAFDDESDRVRYNAKSVIELNNSDENIELIRKETERIIANKFKYDFDSTAFYIRLPDKRRQKEIFDVVLNDSLSLKRKLSELRTFRKYVYEDALITLFSILQDVEKPAELRVAVAEILGWYSFSKNRLKIIQVCEQILNFDESKELKEEIVKTINRLKTGSNNPFTP